MKEQTANGQPAPSERDYVPRGMRTNRRLVVGNSVQVIGRTRSGASLARAQDGTIYELVPVGD
jgi:hypothetical protein